ncbi:MAG: hypothetical protein QXU69_06920 [Thermofilaceae archaeon]
MSERAKEEEGTTIDKRAEEEEGTSVDELAIDLGPQGRERATEVGA